jgi:hypothetical protein
MFAVTNYKILFTMKKIILSSLALLAFGFINAQENIIKANPLSLLGGTDLVSFEHKIGDNSSLLVGVGVGGFTIGGAKYSNFGGEVQYRYYFEEALRGFYAGGQLGYSAGKVKTEFGSFFGESTSSETNYGALTVGAKGGYQWVWGSGFSLDLNLGIAYNKFSYSDSSSTFSSLSASGVLPNFGFGLGYAF